MTYIKLFYKVPPEGILHHSNTSFREEQFLPELLKARLKINKNNLRPEGASCNIATLACESNNFFQNFLKPG